MAKYRQVHTSFWQDGFVLDLTPEEKYFYLYLMTNSKTSQSGIYELPIRIIETETGYNRETITKFINRFVEYGKILFNSETKELMLKNWIKYSPPNSINVISCINKELKEVKTKEFITNYLKLCIENDYKIEGLIRGLEGAYKPLGSNKIINNKQEVINNKQEVINKEPLDIPFEEIINYLNEVAKTNYKFSGNKTKGLIKTRFNEGFTLDDFKKVIDNKCKEWQGTEYEKYLRPETLFGPKFESYLNQKGTSCKNNTKKGTFNNYDQREYNFDDLEKKLLGWEDNEE